MHNLRVSVQEALSCDEWLEISAIVPVWNGRALLERLLASLRRQTRPAAEVLVVDNGSTDGAAGAGPRAGRPRDTAWAAMPASRRP